MTLRDAAYVPLAFHPFTLEFSETALTLFVVQDDGVTVDCPARTITGLTNAAGEVVFHPRFTGATSGESVRMTSDGVMLGTIAARSTDVDGLGGGTGLNSLANMDLLSIVRGGSPQFMYLWMP